ncbi:DUF3991 and TOPRIM domain-containing protein [Eubacterium sp. 1001713B170207_170306_E7]|uniref:DUF3991 and TOPRIM domain-containing protein n=1 Tax=Eubacterium sp. 1001713B170207_170306_E7 TaxID=2787097 RepID=UPI00189ACD26|nr:DUF3991 and TOPRIM domain-containing protein [Eubacterium sp. 1001713B170207_170306_E7]
MYSDDQITFVNQINILDYARAIGLELDYRPKHVLVRGIDSLELTLDGREWHYHYSSIGGGIVQFVTWLQDISWKEAMQQLLDYGRYGTPEQIRILACPIAAKPVTKEKEAPAPFVLPERKKPYRNLFAYLIKTRKISQPVVQYFIEQKKLYMDKHNNCVFLSLNEQGQPVSAFLRGTYDREGKDHFKFIVPGSDERYGFTKEGSNHRLLIFEACIDLMSYMTIKNRQNPSYLYNTQDHFIATNGHKYEPILTYLRAHSEIDQIIFCVDNDARNTMGIIPSEKFMERTKVMVKQAFPERFQEGDHFYKRLPELKDWNDDLRQMTERQEKYKRQKNQNALCR